MAASDDVAVFAMLQTLAAGESFPGRLAGSVTIFDAHGETLARGEVGPITVPDGDGLVADTPYAEARRLDAVIEVPGWGLWVIRAERVDDADNATA